VQNVKRKRAAAYVLFRFCNLFAAYRGYIIVLHRIIAFPLVTLQLYSDHGKFQGIEHSFRGHIERERTSREAYLIQAETLHRQVGEHMNKSDL
jgi:hypothetical protein